MIQTCRDFIRWALAAVAFVALSSCGGGDDDSTPQAVAQSITFASPGDRIFGDPPVALAASASSGLPVVFTSTTPLVCTVSGSTLTLVGAGTCTVSADQAGDATYAAAAPVVNTIVVAPADQTITFVSPGKQTLGSGPVALTATSTSGLAVNFTSITPAVCTISGTSVSLTSEGLCTVEASQPGDANYRAAEVVSQSFEVEAALLAQSIEFPSPGNQTLGTPPAPLAATATSGLPVTFTSMTPGVCTVDGTALTLLSAGACTTTASQAGNATYAAAAVVTQTFTVSNASQTIAFAGPGNQTLGTATPALSATASSGLAVSFSSTTPAVCTVSGTTLTLVALGSCSIDANQTGNAIYAAAPTVTRAITVGAAPLIAQTITFVSPGNQTLGTAPAPLAATASSGLPVSFASTTPSTCSVSGTTLTLVAAGTCIVDASQGGNATYATAPTVSRVFTVAAAPPTAQTITFAGPGNQTLGTPPPALSATASSGLPVTFSATTPAVCTVSGSTLTLVAVGTCSIDANQAGDATYSAAPTVTRSIAVSAAPLIAQTITFAGPGNQTLGTPPPALSATASSGLPVSFSSTTPAVCTVSGNTLTLVAVGTCSIDANQSGDATYSAAPMVSRSVAVSAAPLIAQTITFAGPGNQTLGTPPPALSATASSGLPVSFSSTTPAVCTVSGTTLTLVAAGACSINANQPGNAVFAAAPTVTRGFTVNPAPLLAQTITFASPGNQTLGTVPPALSATASSGLPVSFSSSTIAVCTVSGTTLTLAAVGSCTISANQGGNATYAAAPTVSRTFSVAAAAALVANGGFETAPAAAGQFALGWRGVNSSPATWSTDARSGSRSAELRVPDPGLGGSGLAGNSVDDGGLVPLDPSHWGKSSTLTFWAKGDASQTGNVNFSLRYLNATGNILNPVVNTSFGNQINPSGWTQITLNGTVIPANTSAVFVEMTLAVGPTGVQPPGTCGVDNVTGLPLPCDFRQARVLIDDVSLQVNP